METRIRFNDKIETVKYIGDDYVRPCDRTTENTLYIFGHPFGVTHMVAASNLQDAHSEWIDELPCIDKSELYEAYGFPSQAAYDRFCTLHNEDPELAYEWADLKGIDLHTDGITVPEDFPLLTYGYERQDNSAYNSTGIVNTGNDCWCGMFDGKEFVYIGSLAS